MVDVPSLMLLAAFTVPNMQDYYNNMLNYYNNMLDYYKSMRHFYNIHFYSNISNFYYFM